VHLKKIKLNSEKTRTEYAKQLSTLTPGFSGADIANICNEAAIIAARGNHESVGAPQFEEATERVIGGIAKKNLMTPEERKRVAIHEAGHAVAGWFLENSDPLLKITIIPRSKGALGFAQYLPAEVALKNKEQLLDMVKTALGGRIAEELFYDSVTTGASDDINKVTQIVHGLVQTYGMTDKIGLVGYGSMMGEDSFQKPYSDETNWEIDEEVRRIVKEQYQATRDLLLAKKELIGGLAALLVEKETVNLPDIMGVLGDRPYGMSEAAQDYLKEQMQRKVDAEKLKVEEAEED
jgi:AFG3 family protein